MCSISALVRTTCVALALGMPLGAWASPPAVSADASDQRARSSFVRFAQDWMMKMQQVGSRDHARPSLSAGAAPPRMTYRSYDSNFSTELKRTGHPEAPYVGILRYTEHLHSCADSEAKRCSIAATTPVTEIFRFQNGRWVY